HMRWGVRPQYSQFAFPQPCIFACQPLRYPSNLPVMPLRATARRALHAGILVALLFLACRGAAAHDIPVDVTVQALVKPAGEQLHLLLRVPLKAMRDVEFPERGPGYLDLDRIDTSLNEAATLWISKEIEIYEGDARLPDPRVVETRGWLG